MLKTIPLSIICSFSFIFSSSVLAFNCNDSYLEGGASNQFHQNYGATCPVFSDSHDLTRYSQLSDVTARAFITMEVRSEQLWQPILVTLE
ncbi:hypothetical protein [Photobacterium leiognathi]|uniref:hypothetical protein n=1 Tax=Photobacterium leiognathi TaxID=553611 RepID=UPI002733C2D8|nr:hypothetical protein [Photobacterium leiognathi]